jgi:hypothetical protein
LQLAENVRCRLDVALLPFDVRQDPCDSGALDFNEDLCRSAPQHGRPGLVLFLP